MQMSTGRVRLGGANDRLHSKSSKSRSGPRQPSSARSQDTIGNSSVDLISTAVYYIEARRHRTSSQIAASFLEKNS
jgi:hypothetical protein